MTAAQSRLVNECAELLVRRANQLLAITQTLRRNKKQLDGVVRNLFLSGIRGEAECIANNAATIVKTLTEAGIDSPFVSSGNGGAK